MIGYNTGFKLPETSYAYKDTAITFQSYPLFGGNIERSTFAKLQI